MQYKFYGAAIDFFVSIIYNHLAFAGMMELADVPDSKSGPGDRVRVQVPLPAPNMRLLPQ